MKKERYDYNDSSYYEPQEAMQQEPSASDIANDKQPGCIAKLIALVIIIAAFMAIVSCAKRIISKTKVPAGSRGSSAFEIQTPV